MGRSFRIGRTRVLTAVVMLALGLCQGQAAPRPHVYLFRGLADIFSTGMNVLTDEINNRGVYATSHSHNEWKSLADKAAADFKAGKEGPIILIGHSLGADSVMEMASDLGDKGVPVALVVPFDATQSFAATGNVGRVLNLTQRDYAYMRAGAGFKGSLNNVDLSSDPNIDHLNIDKVPRLHARVIAEILAVLGHQTPVPVATKPDGAKAAHLIEGSVRHDASLSYPAKSGDGSGNASDANSLKTASGSGVIGTPDAHGPTADAVALLTSPSPIPPKPPVAPRPVTPLQIPD
jgi:hypothetical protein